MSLSFASASASIDTGAVNGNAGLVPRSFSSFTMCMWYNLGATANVNALLLQDTAVGEFAGIQLIGGGSHRLRRVHNGGGSGDSATIGDNIANTVGQWYLALAISRAANDVELRIITPAGVETVGTSATAATWTGVPKRVTIGAASGNYRLEHIAFWDLPLSNKQIRELWQGTPPHGLVEAKRRLLFYQPFTSGINELGSIGAHLPAANGAAFSSLMAPVGTVPNIFPVSLLNPAAGGGGESLVRVANETLSVLDTSLRIRGLVRLKNEVLSFLDSSVVVRGLVKVKNEVMSLINSVVSLRGLVKVKNEVLSVLDSSAFIRGLVKVKNETLSLLDSAVTSIIAGLVKVVNETLSISTGAVKLVSELVGGAIVFTQMRVLPKLRMVLKATKAKLSGGPRDAK